MAHYPRIRDLRDDAEWSQAKTADLLGLHKNTYVRYESGEQEIPLSIAIRLAKLYNVSLDYISGLIRSPHPLNPPKK